MELRHLRYFLAVADALNFSRAAERLRVAQPALSRQVHDLEEQIGFKLFERTTTKVSLTEAGSFFQLQVGKLLVQLDIAVTGAQRIAKGTTGDFRIGTGLSASELFITDAARELHQRHPQLSIDFVELPDHEHTQAIRDQKIDVGFVSGNRLTPRKDIDCRLIYTGGIRAILPREHPLANRSEVRLRDLKNERWIVMDEEQIPGFKVLLTQLLRPAQFTPTFGRTARSFQGMLGFVGTGDGIALLPELLLPAEPEGLRYLVTDCAPYEIFAVWLKEHAHPQAPCYFEILQKKIGAAGTAPPAGKRAPRRFARSDPLVRSK
jgi:LysR family transcriptional regulator, benzoate and cis,cis-muconate-responsive activator of ben and cat genes